MTNNRLMHNANKTDLIIIGTSANLLVSSLPPSLLIASHHQTFTVRNLGVTSDNDFNFRKHISLTCRSCLYHIVDLHRIRRCISLSVAKTVATALITSRLNFCNSLYYSIASKDILKLQYVQNCVASFFSHGLVGFPILSHFWNLFTGSLFNLASFSNSALLPIKLFPLENLHIYFPCFLLHPSPENSIHLVFTCCLFPGLKLILGLVFFQLLSLLFGIHSLDRLVIK